MIALLAALALADVPPPAPVEGAYAVVVEQHTTSKVPVVGTAKVVTRSLLLAQLTQNEDGWWQRQQLCGVEIESSTPASTELTQAFIDAVPEESFPVSLQLQDDRWQYRADPGPLYVGYDPDKSDLPNRMRDPGVLDFDGDGHPGATVMLHVPVFGAVRLYIAQHSWTRFSAELSPDGRLIGQVDAVALEQRTLGASVPLFAASPRIDVVPDHSSLTLEPVNANSCDDLLALSAPVADGRR